jgi:hypothetical protein
MDLRSTKVRKIRDNLDDTSKLGESIKFEYVTSFRLLGITIDNKLKKLSNNFVERHNRIKQKIVIWRQLNLSTLGNLIISKKFLISQLGYFLSVLEFSKAKTKEIQEDIDKFVFKGRPWISTDKRYLTAEEGGLGMINIENYGEALRCSWFKRIGKGLWSNILLS